MSTTVPSSTPSPGASTIMTTVTTTMASTATPGLPGEGGGGGTSQQNTSGSIATSASLYLYTFLATLVLLLSVSAAIVIRSFILRRRHRLMVEEAIRNGTWVPPTPPSRPARVDLSKKPVLWEAYIDEKGSVAAVYALDGSAEGKGIQHDHWRSEHPRDWDTIKPFSAAYVTKTPELVAGATAAIAVSSTPSLPLDTVPAPTTGLGATPSATSVHNLGLPANDVSANTTTSGVATAAPASAPAPLPLPVTTPAPAPRTPQHRAFFSRAMRMLNPTPDQTSPLPSPVGSGSTADLHHQRGAEIAMAELNHSSTAPSMMRVAVLIAMPAPPSSSGSLSASATSSSSLSPSPSSLPNASPTHPLQPSTRPVVTSLSSDDDEHPLPHLEVGVAEVLMVPPEMTSSYPRGKVRDSVGSQGSRDSDGSPV